MVLVGKGLDGLGCCNGGLLTSKENLIITAFREIIHAEEASSFKLIVILEVRAMVSQKGYKKLC